MCVQADAVHAHRRATVRWYAPQVVTAGAVGSENQFPAVGSPNHSIHQGQRKAARSLVVLTMTWGSKTLSFTRTNSGPLSPGQMDIVTFDVKLSLVQAKFCATADSTNRVIESNEDNNKLCGQFEGKP